MVQAAITNLIDPPPRLTGDAGHDTVAVIQWLNAFYTKGILSGSLLQPQNLAPALISLGALPGVADTLAYYTAEDTFDLTGFTAWARTLLEAADAAAGRIVLGLGALAVNNTVDLATEVTGNLSVTHLNSGTGAAAGNFWQGDGSWGTPAGAGDVVGPAGATDGNVALFNTATGKLIKDGGTLGTAAFTASTAYDASGAAAAVTPTTLGLVIGTNTQAHSSRLDSIAGLADAAGWLHNSGLGVFTYSTPSAADVGAQPADADLTTWASITPGANVGTALAVAVGTDGAFVVKGGALGTPSGGTLTNASGLPAAGVTGTALVAAAIGTTVQAYDADLAAIAALSSADSNFIVGSAGGWVVESGATVRASLGLGSSAVLNYVAPTAWTPTDGSGAGLALTVNNARYSRNGDLVTVTGYIAYPATANAAAAIISGLPVAVNASCYATGATRTDCLTNPITLTAIAGSSDLYLHTGANVNVTNAQMSGKFLMFAVTYLG